MLTRQLGKLLPVLCLWLPLATLSAADDCRETNKTGDRFDLNEDGTVTDIESGLTWMRCLAGQVWNQNACRGTAERVSWSHALTYTTKFNELSGFAGQHDWRPPRLNELALLADRHCRTPRIDLAYFPATPAAGFWTTDSVPTQAGKYYALSFGREGVLQANNTKNITCA